MKLHLRRVMPSQPGGRLAPPLSKRDRDRTVILLDGRTRFGRSLKKSDVILAFGPPKELPEDDEEEEEEPEGQPSARKKNYMISREHADIFEHTDENGKPFYTLCDSSLNGTYVNDTRVMVSEKEESSFLEDQKKRTGHFNKKSYSLIKEGDIIKFGHMNGSHIKPKKYAPQVNSRFTFICERINPKINYLGFEKKDDGKYARNNKRLAVWSSTAVITQDGENHCMDDEDEEEEVVAPVVANIENVEEEDVLINVENDDDEDVENVDVTGIVKRIVDEDYSNHLVRRPIELSDPSVVGGPIEAADPIDVANSDDVADPIDVVGTIEVTTDPVDVVVPIDVTVVDPTDIAESTHVASPIHIAGPIDNANLVGPIDVVAVSNNQHQDEMHPGQQPAHPQNMVPSSAQLYPHLVRPRVQTPAARSQVSTPSTSSGMPNAFDQTVMQTLLQMHFQQQLPHIQQQQQSQQLQLQQQQQELAMKNLAAFGIPPHLAAQMLQPQATQTQQAPLQQPQAVFPHLAPYDQNDFYKTLLAQMAPPSNFGLLNAYNQHQKMQQLNNPFSAASLLQHQQHQQPHQQPAPVPQQQQHQQAASAAPVPTAVSIVVSPEDQRLLIPVQHARMQNSPSIAPVNANIPSTSAGSTSSSSSSTSTGETPHPVDPDINQLQGPSKTPPVECDSSVPSPPKQTKEPTPPEVVAQSQPEPQQQQIQASPLPAKEIVLKAQEKEPEVVRITIQVNKVVEENVEPRASTSTSPPVVIAAAPEIADDDGNVPWTASPSPVAETARESVDDEHIDVDDDDVVVAKEQEKEPEQPEDDDDEEIQIIEEQKPVVVKETEQQKESVAKKSPIASPTGSETNKRRKRTNEVNNLFIGCAETNKMNKSSPGVHRRPTEDRVLERLAKKEMKKKEKAAAAALQNTPKDAKMSRLKQLSEEEDASTSEDDNNKSRGPSQSRTRAKSNSSKKSSNRPHSEDDDESEEEEEEEEDDEEEKSSKRKNRRKKGSEVGTAKKATAAKPVGRRPKKTSLKRGKTVDDDVEEEEVTVPKKRGPPKRKTREMLDTCGAVKDCRIGVDAETVAWVECEDCSQWWHCLCHPFINSNTVGKVAKFSCCTDPPTVVLNTAAVQKKGAKKRA